MAFIFKMLWSSKLIMNSIIAIIIFYLIDWYYNTNICNKKNNIDTKNIESKNIDTNNKSFSDLFKQNNTEYEKQTEMPKRQTEQQEKHKIFKFYMRMFISVFISTALTNLFW
jgi:hypothetical protein